MPESLPHMRLPDFEDNKQYLRLFIPTNGEKSALPVRLKLNLDLLAQILTEVRQCSDMAVDVECMQGSEQNVCKFH